MFNTFRKHQQTLMIIITLLVIVAFAFLYDYNRSPVGGDDVGKIYGRPIRKVDAERGVRYFRLAMNLGMMDMVQTLTGRAQDENSAILQFIVNLEVMRHEAREMGLSPGEDQLRPVIMGLPAFQTDGKYDPYKFEAFIQERLGSMGFTTAQIDELAKDAWMLKRLREIITSQVAVSVSEVDQALKMFQPVDLEVARFTLADAAKNITVSDEEIIRDYNENKANLLTNETRSVQFVKIDLPPGGAEGAKDKASLEALQKIADSAAAFADDAGKDGLSAAAKKAGYKVSDTPEFNQLGLVPDAKTQKPDEAFMALAPAAFQLAAAGSVSDVIQAGDAFYVISLKNITPARILALEEVKSRIREKLKNAAARKAMEISARESIEKIRQLMRDGKPFADAAKEAGVQVESVLSATPTPTSEAAKVDTEAQTFAASALYLKDGGLSGLENAPWGGYAVYLVKRKPADSAFITEQKSKIEGFLQRRNEEILFAEWFRSARETANFQTPRG